MIVYGDPQYEETFAALAATLRSRAVKALALDPTSSVYLDHLRTLLILAGQLEQAVHDSNTTAENTERHISQLHAATRHAASAFYAAWASSLLDAFTPALSTHEALSLLIEQLDTLDVAPDKALTVKIPEGFAFYALYPEQYFASALRWLSDHADISHGNLLVVGIRSIGTTLAAAISATLEAGGWKVNSFTVRPAGHPFARHTDIDSEQVAGAEWAIVVDEGPGLSGSSMASVGEALMCAGFARERISFFPGHDREPGSAASEQVRAWWSTTPRYVTPLSGIRFDGRPLPEVLAASLHSFLREDEQVVRIEDLGGGQWRKVNYPGQESWPAIFPPFERPKYLCTTSTGQRVLFKFEGLAHIPGGAMTDVAAEHMQQRADLGWGPAPIGITHGFVCAPWLAGTPLTRSDANPYLLAQVGRYMAQAAGPPLPTAARTAAFDRLSDMLYWNTWESLGEPAALHTRELADEIATSIPAISTRTYGDGHLAPHEWLLSPDDHLAKVDSTGHQWDHTAIGSQPLLWDVAGAMVEWCLDDGGIATLLDAFHAAGGGLIPVNILNFYRMAYAAFRMGQSHLCAGIYSHDTAEQDRLWRAYSYYRDHLTRLLPDEVEP